MDQFKEFKEQLMPKKEEVIEAAVNEAFSIGEDGAEKPKKKKRRTSYKRKKLKDNNFISIDELFLIRPFPPHVQGNPELERQHEEAEAERIEEVRKMLDKMPLNDKLRAMRRTVGLTQQQVAKSLNIDRSTYTYYETGKTAPDIRTIMKLLRIFNVTYEELLGRVSPPKRTPFIGSSEYDPNFGRINELTKQERLMVISYRLISSEKRKEYLTNLLYDARHQPGEEF